MCKRFYLLVLVLLSGIVTVPASAQSRDMDYRVTIQNFFNLIEQGQYVEALDYLYEDNPWIQNQQDNFQTLKTQFSGLSGLVGAYHGYEKLSDENLAGRLVRVDYIVFYERQPIRFEFQFYRAGDQWMTYAFLFNDDLATWLEEKVQAKYWRSFD